MRTLQFQTVEELLQHWNALCKLGCPHLRGGWTALFFDPCPYCSWTHCHNYDRPFHRPDYLTILEVCK